MTPTVQPTARRAYVYDYAVRVTEIATETLRLSPEAAAEAGADLNRRWHDVETERVSPDLIEVTTA